MPSVPGHCWWTTRAGVGNGNSEFGGVLLAGSMWLLSVCDSELQLLECEVGQLVPGHLLPEANQASPGP